jgi:hypothetical protein
MRTPPPLSNTLNIQKLFCLHGQHRIKAAESFLPHENQWWTIRIYLIRSDGTQTSVLDPKPWLTLILGEFEKLAARWTDDYSHQAAFREGEIYRRVWGFRQQGAEAHESFWMARLSSSKQDNSLRRFMNRAGFTTRLDTPTRFSWLMGRTGARKRPKPFRRQMRRGNISTDHACSPKSQSVQDAKRYLNHSERYGITLLFGAKTSEGRLISRHRRIAAQSPRH